MTFQNLLITKPSKLSCANNCLVVTQRDEGVVSIPLHNINLILIENPQITVSSFLMQQCVENGVIIICCNDKHMPAGVMHGYNTHFQASRILDMQIALSIPAKKQLWKSIIQNKILSQACNLCYIGSEKYSNITGYINEVKSGDVGNIEAICARVYFSEMFKNFRRFDDDKINIMLNYGYSLIRSTIAKYLVVSGLNPAMGIMHRNQFNNFNLADDIIEVFRYIVDMKVYNYSKQDDIFTKDDRVYLFEIFEAKVQFDDGSLNLINAIEKVIQSFQRVVKSGNVKELMTPIHKIDKYRILV